MLALLAALFLAGTAHAAGNPDFDAVAWTPLGCDVADLVSHTSPANFDFAGDATFPAVYFAHDATYLYFRYRMDGDPAGAGGFAQGAWTALMQVPSGNAFQYQYQLSLNGKTDTIEVWQNTVAMDISFSPLFHDDAELKLFSQGYAFTSGSTVNTTPLARRLQAGDGSSFDGGPDYFVDFAFPVSVMVANGVISSAADLDDAVFFPATATNPNNYNKGHLNCTFLPGADVTVSKSVSPSSAPANTTTPLDYTITVANEGAGIAKGITVDDPMLPAYMTNVAVSVSADNPGAVWSVVTTNPLQVKIDTLPAGATLTIHLTADAHPTCGDGDFTNIVSASGVNVMAMSGSALLSVAPSSASEVCDGVDNNCDGQVDEGGAALCDDENPCTVDACGGEAGCSHDAIPGCVPCETASDCDDGNACTTETCDGGVCGHDPIPGCTSCESPSDCNDGNACTTETCIGGVCGHDPVPGCTPCESPSDCNDGNACTTETCIGGVCGHDPVPGCTPCSSPSDCNDGNACTTETCNGGVCGHDPVPGCTPCSSPSDCNDGNACTTETCIGGVCGHDPVPGCTPCESPSDCNDGNACTTETCDNGVCGHIALEDCIPCETDGQCADGNGCTTDACVAGQCANTIIEGCVPCETAADCNDHDGCTTDTCNESGVCEHASQDGCIPCTTAAQCNDQNPCTTDACGADGSCQITAIPGCQRCTTVADCNDGNECTVEACTGGVCVHTADPECEKTPENCTDGVDNDGDGLVDCADADCANDPACRHEICGNCIDDDGDGLVDGEDPDCCGGDAQAQWLLVKKLVMKPGAATVTGRPIRGDHLKLRTRYKMGVPAGFNPTTQDTEVQLSDANGQIFCANVAANHWSHPNRRVYRFKDKTGTFAGGLKKGRFRLKKNGKLAFVTRGKKMIVREPTNDTVHITVRVGNVCAQETKQLRTKASKALVYP
jgi:uncharacterized repeat protein (TIGR01451 family)